MLEDKRIQLEPEFTIMEVDSGKQVIRSFDEREVGYDLLVTVPLNMGVRRHRPLGDGRRS